MRGRRGDEVTGPSGDQEVEIGGSGNQEIKLRIMGLTGEVPLGKLGGAAWDWRLTGAS
ncbi:MAG: hypothetical protein ACYTEL_16150 [Planctomycetota bacterium]